uniref:Secreted protein n=1 Tax=Cacopsylla melanoneura TaxID=428564 RepID=A0A8D8WF00_9HEMI
MLGKLLFDLLVGSCCICMEDNCSPGLPPELYITPCICWKLAGTPPPVLYPFGPAAPACCCCACCWTAIICLHSALGVNASVGVILGGRCERIYMRWAAGPPCMALVRWGDCWRRGLEPLPCCCGRIMGPEGGIGCCCIGGRGL